MCAAWKSPVNSRIHILSLTFFPSHWKKKHSRNGYLVRSIGHSAKSHLCTGGASENTQCAFKLHIVIEKGEKEERERKRECV